MLAPGLDVELPDERVVRTLAYKDAVPLADPAAVLDAVLAEPNGTPPLAELARGREDACIVICDITRPVPNQTDPATHSFHAGSGRHPAAIRSPILIATGLHRPNEGEELVELVGDEIAANYRVENHHGQQRRGAHATWAPVPAACPFWIDSRYVEADLKITIGLIEPHLMAGFSGGRKLICPGLAALETVKVWHGPRVHRASQRRLRHPRRQPGSRREHLDRPAHGLRLHRQRGDRRRAAAAQVRGRRHGSRVS